MHQVWLQMQMNSGCRRLKFVALSQGLTVLGLRQRTVNRTELQNGNRRPMARVSLLSIQRISKRQLTKLSKGFLLKVFFQKRILQSRNRYLSPFTEVPNVTRNCWCNDFTDVWPFLLQSHHLITYILIINIFIINIFGSNVNGKGEDNKGSQRYSICQSSTPWLRMTNR